MNSILFLFLITAIYFPSIISGEFESSILTISVDENTPVNKKITNLRIELKINDSQTTFLPFTTTYFRLTKQGDIFIQHSLDRDNDSNLCSDNGFPDVCSTTQVVWVGNSIIISLRIVINDLNDNVPFWPNIPSVSIAENSPVDMEVDLPLAIDKDINTNGIERYELITSNVMEFELKNQQSPNGIIPKLIVKTNLDREKVKNYNLTLAAIDGARPHHTGTVVLFVEIADQNDNSPIFEKSTYRVTIFENFTVSTYLPIQPHATDADSGKFGEISYNFSIATPEDVKNIFSIDKTTGQILVEKNIDYDAGKHSFEFIIVATDGGSPALSSTASILIEINDVNDQSPVIVINIVPTDKDEINSILEFPENAPSNQLVTTITVSDIDTGDGGIFNCSLSLTNSFSMNFYKSFEKISIYQLISVRQFDRESESNIHTQILCQDKGNPVKSSKKLITVNISDVNDNPPRFSQPKYKYQFKEENDLHTQIGEVFVTDQDIGNNSRIEYFIIASEKEKNIFQIDKKGIIYATVRIDRELNPDGFRFQILAKDCGNPYLNDSAEVEIEIIDINDCIPKFKKEQYPFQTMENDGLKQTPQLPIGVVEASDCDTGNNAKMSFKLAEPSKLFQVTEKGIVEQIGIIDREIQSFYSLTVLVIDSIPTSMQRNTGTTIINITIDDRNDNPPIFIPSMNISNPARIKVSYEEEIGFEIHKVYAKDADAGLNSIINYKIKSNNYNNNLFAINDKTGSITIAKRLTSNNQGEKSLVIIAMDNGSPSLSSEITLIVIIDDSIPNSPTPNGNRYLINNNKLIIIIVVIATVLVCGILISVICLMVNCKFSPHRNGIRMTYDEDGTKPIASFPHQGYPKYDINNGKFTDVNESLLNLSSNFYLINNQPSSNNCVPAQSVGYHFDTYNPALNTYQKMSSNDLMDTDSEIGINRHLSHSNMMIDRKIPSTNYRQSPQLFSPQKTIDLDNNQQNNSYRKFMEESNNNTINNNNNLDINSRTMNWTIRSGYFDQPNYEIMYDTMNSQTGYANCRIPNIKTDANIISSSGL